MKRRTFTAERAGHLVDVVGQALELTVQHASALISAGAVYVDGRRCRESTKSVPKGAQLAAVLEEAGQAPAPPQNADALVVLFEDARVIAVDKPAGVIAQPGLSGRDNLLARVSRHL